MSNGSARDVATVVAAAGEIVGRTRLQKTLAILELAGLGYGFPFEYYKFGPFSEDAVVSLDRAVDLGYIKEEERRAVWGGRYSTFSSPEIRSSGNVARDQIIAIAKSADAIALELAVTAAFLAEHGSTDAWREVAARKPEKAVPDRLLQARELYARFAEIADVPKALPQLG